MPHSLERLPPLDTLRAFEAAARLGSFTSAARELNLTHGAISRQIARLENWFGQPLFDRHGRGVAVTTSGNMMLMRTRDAFAVISEGGDRWRPVRGPAQVRLTVVPSVAVLWLLPRVAALETGEPPLRLELSVEDRSAELASEAFDLGIRFGRGQKVGRIGIPMFNAPCFPIASPGLAARIGKGGPERLFAVPLVNDNDAADWQTWFMLRGLDYRPRPQDRRFVDYTVTIEAITQGLGVGLARPPLTDDAIKSGRLVRVDVATAPTSGGYWMDRPIGRPRAAAGLLARRILAAAGLPDSTADRFLGG